MGPHTIKEDSRQDDYDVDVIYKDRKLKKEKTSLPRLICRNGKKESELEAALVRLRDLEALINSKDAALSTALSEKRSLEAEVKDLKAQLAKVRRLLLDMRVLGFFFQKTCRNVCLLIRQCSASVCL